LLLIDKANAIAPLQPANHKKNCFLESIGSVLVTLTILEQMKIFRKRENRIIISKVIIKEKVNCLNFLFFQILKILKKILLNFEIMINNKILMYYRIKKVFD